jgi:hypothetical protein
MNPGGKTAGGGKGGGRRKCGGGDEVLKKSFALQTTRAHMLTLRQALTTDAGKDRNVCAMLALLLLAMNIALGRVRQGSDLPCARR